MDGTPTDVAKTVRSKAAEDLHNPVMNTADGAAAILGGLSGKDWNAVAEELVKPPSDPTLPLARVMHLGQIKCIEFTPGPGDHRPLARQKLPLCSGEASNLEMQQK